MTAESNPPYCTLLVRPSRTAGGAFDLAEARRVLESGSEKAKIETMKEVLEAVANGEPAGPLVMHIIRFVMPNQKNKLLKKLVLLFFELVPKVDEEGRLLQEMILLWYQLAGVSPLVLMSC
jgi:coatomer subunit beta